MPFMPFQILGMWLRGLLALALWGTAIALLIAWYNHREHAVEVPAQPTADTRMNGSTRDDGEISVRETRVERVPWEFGWNRETAFLLGGLALLSWSLGGGLLGPRFLRRAAEDEPQSLRSNEVRRLTRPDGTELHVEFFGPAEGVPLVMVHGWGQDSQVWYYAKKELAVRHRLIVWDLPGLGQSRGPTDNNWSLEKMSHDLNAVIALAGNRPAYLVGHSIGGMILLTYCRLFPEALGTRVRGLVIAHGTYTNPVKTTSMAGLYTALQKPILEPLCHLMIWLAPLFWALNFLSYLNGSAHRSTERSSFSGQETRGQLTFMSRYIIAAWPGVLARGMLGMFRYDATETLRTISVPTLIVGADRDSTCVPEASVFMSQTIPGARLMMLQNAKHAGQFEHHAPFHDAVEQFVAAQGN